MRVRVDSISKVYHAPAGGRLVTLDNVSLDIGDGEFVTILGPSGGGKSTLLQVVAGLEAPTRGRVTFAWMAEERGWDRACSGRNTPCASLRWGGRKPRRPRRSERERGRAGAPAGGKAT